MQYKHLTDFSDIEKDFFTRLVIQLVQTAHMPISGELLVERRRKSTESPPMLSPPPVFIPQARREEEEEEEEQGIAATQVEL